jgi:two-component system NarL family response regulator
VTIRVVLIDHRRMLREALCALIANSPEVRVVGDAGSGRDAIRLVKKLVPEVLVLDDRLPDLSGLEVAHRLRAAGSVTKILALCDHNDRRLGQKMLRSGLSGYVTEAASAKELTCAIRSVARGARYTASMSATSARANANGSEHPPSAGCLGTREREVLRMVAEGAQSSAIAMELGIAVGTVDVHRRNLMRKLNLHTVATLTRYAIRQGLTSP